MCLGIESYEANLESANISWKKPSGTLICGAITARSCYTELLLWTSRWAQAGVESCPPACATTRPSLHAADCENFSSTVDGIQKIVRREGFRALWRGLDASLMMAVPAVTP